MAPQVVLIGQLAKLGDMVCTTPMFRAVKKKYPKCRLIVVGLSGNEELLRGNSDVDEYLAYTGNPFSLLKRIRKSECDFACIATPNFVFLALLYLSGIPLIAVPTIVNGFSPYETRSYKLLRNLVATAPHSMGSYASREYLRLLELIGITDRDTTKHLVFSRQASERIDTFLGTIEVLKNDFVVGITPGAGNKLKQWPPERFARLSDYLIQQYNARIIIIGSRGDMEEGKEMLSFLKNKDGVTDTVGNFSIDELKALVSKLSLFIGVDTGPIYIAEAFGVPTIDIIGPMDEHEQPPRGRLNEIVVAERLQPVMHIMNARQLDEVEARRQVEAITVEMVTKAVDRVLSQLNFNQERV